MPGVDAVMAEAGITALPKNVNRVVFVGNKISPGNPDEKPDGTVVRTLWGEIAWQLGGKEGLRAGSRRTTRERQTPATRYEIYQQVGPCLILIDEWVAYARQLHDDADLPAGTFETHFTFAQALTKPPRRRRHCCW